MDKPTVAAPPGHHPRSRPEEKKRASDYFAEWCGSILFICIATLAIAGTYKLLLMMYQ